MNWVPIAIGVWLVGGALVLGVMALAKLADRRIERLIEEARRGKLDH